MRIAFILCGCVFLLAPVASAVSPLHAAAAVGLSARDRNERATFVAQSENAQATYARRVDDQLRALRQEIDRKNGELTALKSDLAGARRGSKQTVGALTTRIDRLLGELADAQTRFADELGARDADFARERTLLLSVGDDLLRTPEGAEALARYNAGGAGSFEVADAILDRLAQARARAREDGARLAHAADERVRATLALDARGKGLTTTDTAIKRFEAVVAIAPESFDDRIALAQLYRDANRLDDAATAASTAFRNAAADGQKASALIEQGDALMLQARDDKALQEFDGGVAGLAPFISAVAKMSELKTKEDAIAAADVMAGVMTQFAAMIAVFRAPTQIDEAERLYTQALALLPAGGGDDAADRDRQSRRAVALTRLGEVHALRQRASKITGLQAGIVDMGLFFRQSVLKAAETNVWDNSAVNRGMTERLAAMSLIISNNTELHASRALHEQSKAVREALVARFPTVQAYRERLADSLDRIGASFVEENEYAKATASFEQSLAIRRPLVAADPSSTALREDLSSTLREIGLARLGAKDQAAAIAYFTECHALREGLAQADPTSAAYQRNIATALEGLAMAKAPGYDWKRVERQYDLMRERHMLAPSDDRAAKIAHLNASDIFAPK